MSFKVQQCTRHVLHTASFSTKKLFHTPFSTQKVLHTAHFHTAKLLHTGIVLHGTTFTHSSSFYTEKFLHAGNFYTDKPLETDAFKHGNFLTEKVLHTEALSDRTSIVIVCAILPVLVCIAELAQSTSQSQYYLSYKTSITTSFGNHGI